MGVSVRSRPTASATILVISGELDNASEEIFQESLLREARSQRPPLLLDLSGIDSIDYAGLSALITIRRLVAARDCELRIISTSKAVRAIADVMDMQHVLNEVPRAFASRRTG